MRALIDRYIDAYNRIDVDAMLATMHSEVIFENYTAGVLGVRTAGIHELRHLAESSRHLFSARRQTITRYAEAGGVAHAQIHFEGTFAIDLPNGIRAGQSIALNGRSEYREREGKLIYIADFSELASALALSTALQRCRVGNGKSRPNVRLISDGHT